MNLSHRQESPRFNSTLSRDKSGRHCGYHRPVSADFIDRHHPGSELSYKSRTIGSSSQSLCDQPRGFCSTRHVPMWSGSAGALHSQVSRRVHMDVDFVQGREDPFRHAYTYQSAELLKTLLRDKWKSDESDGSVRSDLETKNGNRLNPAGRNADDDNLEKIDVIRDAEVDLEFERWFPGPDRKYTRPETSAKEVEKTSPSSCLGDLLIYEENDTVENNASPVVKECQTTKTDNLRWLDPEILEGSSNLEVPIDKSSAGNKKTVDNSCIHKCAGGTQHFTVKIVDKNCCRITDKPFTGANEKRPDSKNVRHTHKSKNSVDFKKPSLTLKTDICDDNSKNIDCSNFSCASKMPDTTKSCCTETVGHFCGAPQMEKDRQPFNDHFNYLLKEDLYSGNLRDSARSGAFLLLEKEETGKKFKEKNNVHFCDNESLRGFAQEMPVNLKEDVANQIERRETPDKDISNFQSVDNPDCKNNKTDIEKKAPLGFSQYDLQRNCETSENAAIENISSSSDNYVRHLEECSLGKTPRDSLEFGADLNCKKKGTEETSQLASSNVSTSRKIEENPKGTPRDSTYDDLVSILNVLEGDETEPLLGDVNSSARRSPLPEDLASGKQVREIFNYLEQVERCSETENKQVLRPVFSSSSVPMPILDSSTVPRLDELLCRNSVDLAQEVLSLRLQAEEQANGLKLLQQTIADLKASAMEAKTNLRAEMEKASNEAESAILRHQKMVKQLLSEKKNLNEKISALVAEMKSTEERHQRNMKTMEERHLVELQRVKETQAAAEKLKREKWIDVKTQKIKEMTVKGLEPELSRMAARQQQELSELRSLHRAELEAVELRAARRTTELMDQLRVELTRDKEDALQREAALLRARWDKQQEEEQRRYEDEVRRLKDEKRRETERVTLLEIQFQETLAEARRSADREKERDKEILVREWEEKLDNLHRQHQSDLKNVKESMELEKEAWMNNYKKMQTNKFLEREAELHHQYKQERDRDIEMAIDRLETEEHKTRQELQEAAENRLKRLRDKYETEIKDAEAEISSLKTKLSESKIMLVKKEDQVTDLESKLRHCQNDLTQLKKLSDDMTAERSDIRKTLRSEVAAELAAAKESVEAVRAEMATLKASHAVELERKDELLRAAKLDAEKELQSVYNRVKTTIRKKDDAMETVKEQYKVALERCTHLEQMLDNQRRNLLLK